MIDEIVQALLRAHPADLETIRQYVQWVAIRRRVHNHFYQRVHWVQSPPRAHWL